MNSDNDGDFSMRAYARRKNISSVSSVLKDVIHKCLKTKPKHINIMDLASQYQGNHRRLYELFNLLTYFGVTQSSGRGKLAWVGFDSLFKTLEEKFSKIEQTYDKMGIQAAFQLDQSLLLGQIATNFLALFSFLNVEYVNIKNVTNLFSYGIADRKALDRRVYLSLSLLETVGYIEHKTRSGQYKILIDVNAMIKKVSENNPPSPQEMLSIDNLLNRSTKSYNLANKYLERQKEYEKVTNIPEKEL